MEIFELRYFLGVAKFQNIHKASESLRISPGSLSKAVSRLEDELSVKLFSREGRHIKLTEHGRILQKRASEMIQLEENTTLEIAGHKGAIQVIIAGPEVFLSKMGVQLTARMKKKYPLSVFEFLATDDEEALEQIKNGNAHFAITTAEFPTKSEYKIKCLEETTFQTFVGISHPLYTIAQTNKTIPIEKVLQYPFVSPTNSLLGKVGIKQSLDGWRDDHFPRKVEYKTSSLKLLEELVVSGKAIGYLPEYYCKNLPIKLLKISGCPYSCSQKINLVARNNHHNSWMHYLFN